MFDTHACEPSQMLLLNQLGTYYKYDDDVSMHFPADCKAGACYVSNLRQPNKKRKLPSRKQTNEKLQVDNQHFC